MLSSLLSLSSTSSCNFCSDTVAMSILSLSVLGFFILFSVATFLSTREDKILLETKLEDLGISILNPSIRLLTIMSDPKTINNFLISSLLYLSVLLLCLVNYFVNSCIWLSINLLLILITTCFVFFIICKCYINWKIVTTKEIKKFIKETQWLKGKYNH